MALIDKLEAIADGFRSSRGLTDKLTLDEMAVLAAESGSGSVEGVHFVTFMSEDGLTELYKRPVADGDNCADPVARGLIETPTKESTVQYDYAYAGWSATAGGSADSAALSAVTEDCVVYAAYTSTVRYYTITYYDGDTVLKTESLPYGAKPNYVPIKDGSTFSNWSPELTTVIGDANYQAVWIEIITFAGSSWGKIAEVAESGEARNYFSLGDTKTFVDKTSTAATYTATIIGFNHDDLADGTGKAGLTLAITPNYGSMLQGKCTSTGWKDHASRSRANTLVNSVLPEDLSSVLKTVRKSSLCGDSFIDTDDKAFTPTAKEFNFTGNKVDSTYKDYAEDGGSTYEYFVEGGKPPYVGGGFLLRSYPPKSIHGKSDPILFYYNTSIVTVNAYGYLDYNIRTMYCVCI